MMDWNGNGGRDSFDTYWDLKLLNNGKQPSGSIHSSGKAKQKDAEPTEPRELKPWECRLTSYFLSLIIGCMVMGVIFLIPNAVNTLNRITMDAFPFLWVLSMVLLGEFFCWLYYHESES